MVRVPKEQPASGCRMRNDPAGVGRLGAFEPSFFLGCCIGVTEDDSQHIHKAGLAQQIGDARHSRSSQPQKAC